MHSLVLFICTGNYYRSRFAEIYFNHLAEAQNHGWRAFSRGFRPGSHNSGEISVFAVEGLVKKGILISQNRMPEKLLEADLNKASKIIALKEKEHRRMMQEHFPAWEEAVTYWHIHDIDAAHPEDALNELEINLKNLLEELRTQG